eukprot:COSAG05_NODE_11133_length_529_cov_0.786047_2_plen_92_part_01
MVRFRFLAAQGGDTGLVEIHELAGVLGGESVVVILGCMWVKAWHRTDVVANIYREQATYVHFYPGWRGDGAPELPPWRPGHLKPRKMAKIDS